MNILKNFFTTQYLFEINRVMLEKGDKYFFVAGLALAIVAIVFKIFAIYAPDEVNKKYRQKYFKLFSSIGVCELIWYGARVMYIRFFGTHFVAWLIALIGIIWFIKLTVKMFKNFGKEKTQWDKDQVKMKYLPK